MPKVFKYIVLFVAIFYWSISHFKSLYNWAGKSGIFPDDYRYGDLYRLSFLPQFKEKAPECAPYTKGNTKKNVNLYLIGDSFTDQYKLNGNDFISKTYQRTPWESTLKVNLEKTSKNILIIESVERSAKMHFVSLANNFRIENQKESDKIENESIWIKAKNTVSLFSSNTKATEERLWHTLFNYDFFLIFKEIKARLDLKLFDRKSSNYVLSEDKSNIFYFEEADPSTPHSAFYKVSDKEIEEFVNNMNSDAEHYKKMGFDEVYFSIIPNKVTVLAPEMGTYNHVLERIQNHKKLNVKLIDVSNDFQKEPSKIFLKSDTHWSCFGRDLWLKKVNDILQK
jgi:hypothetical protein